MDNAGVRKIQMSTPFDFFTIKNYIAMGLKYYISGCLVDGVTFDVIGIESMQQGPIFINITGWINAPDDRSPFGISVGGNEFGKIVTLGFQHYYGKNHELKLWNNWTNTHSYDMILTISELGGKS